MTTKQSEAVNPVEVLLVYLDFHLSMLHNAIQKNNEEEKSFHTVELEQIRERLIAYSYFKS